MTAKGKVYCCQVETWYKRNCPEFTMITPTITPSNSKLVA